jgi:hypothetical protein
MPVNDKCYPVSTANVSFDYLVCAAKQRQR